jgi:hypothetical protein
MVQVQPTRRGTKDPTHGSGWIVHVQPTLKGTKKRLRIPPTAVGGWFKSSLHAEARREPLRIPPTAVGGWFKSSLHSKARRNVSESHPLAVGGWFKSSLHSKARRNVFESPANPIRKGLERSTHCRGWDSERFLRASACRLHLNHPPTAVGGINGAAEADHTS